MCCSGPEAGLLLEGGNLKTSSETRTREKEKRKCTAWSEKQVEQEEAAAGQARPARAREPPDTGPCFRSQAWGFRPVGSFERNQKLGVSLQTLQSRSVPGSGPPLLPPVPLVPVFVAQRPRGRVCARAHSLPQPAERRAACGSGAQCTLYFRLQVSEHNKIFGL